LAAEKYAIEREVSGNTTEKREGQGAIFDKMATITSLAGIGIRHVHWTFLTSEKSLAMIGIDLVYVCENAIVALFYRIRREKKRWATNAKCPDVLS
jgi:hypothetical protein